MPVDESWDESGLVGKLAGGKYLIGRAVHKGPRSEIFEATDSSNGAQVALKVLRNHFASAPLQAAVREKRKVTAFAHPHIVDIAEIGRLDDGAPFVASELVGGEPLSTLIKDGFNDPNRALTIMRQVLDALQAAHAGGVVHGNVSPEHVLVVRTRPSAVDVMKDGVTDQVKLLGLGLARFIKAPATSFADPNYIAPEYVQGARGSTRSDLYSVGAVLFELLTGYPPFFADDAKALMRLHAYAAVQTLTQRAPERSFTQETEELVARALEKQPAKRFQTAQEMIAAIDTALASIEQAEAAAAANEAPPPPEHKLDDSFLIAARDLVPVVDEPEAPALVIPNNVERKVPTLPWSMRARKQLQRVTDKARPIADPVVARFRAMPRMYRLAAAGGAALLLLVVVIAILPGGADRDSDSGPDQRSAATAGTPVPKITPAIAPVDDALLRRAETLLADAKAKETADLLAKEIVPATAAKPRLVALLSRLLAFDDREAAMTGLEVVTRLTPLPVDLVLEQAATAPLPDVRHRAVQIAESTGNAKRIDRVASWSLDLEQATSCDERRAVIAKLAGTGDQRAVTPLRKASATKCVAQDAIAAIATLEASKK